MLIFIFDCFTLKVHIIPGGGPPIPPCICILSIAAMLPVRLYHAIMRRGGLVEIPIEKRISISFEITYHMRLIVGDLQSTRP